MHDRAGSSGLDFLAGGGAAGALMRSMDWSASPLGQPRSWSQSLRTVVSLLLNSKFPMFIAWGPDLGFLYNDPYSEILGAKHPAAMGRRFKEIWSEIWDDIKPSIDKALAGEATFHEDMPLMMRRRGFDEQTYFTFSYSPVHDETGRIGGMFCACTETTKEVEARAALQADREYLHRLFTQAPGIMAMLSGPEHVFQLANASYLELVGERELIGKTVLQAIPELEDQGFIALLDDAYATGKPFIGREVPVTLQRRHDAPPETRYVDFVYQPVTNDQGRVTGIFVEGHDVTDRALALHHQHLLINELNHRVKNTLATVQAIAAQSFRDVDGESSQELKTFNGRLFALARAHDVLTRENWDGAELREVIAEVLEPYLRQSGKRFEIDGPRLRLTSGMALALAMAIHELATNAAKYGALSTPSGCVAIKWTITDEGAPFLTLLWEEHGGPPVASPTRKGFGTRLIERMLANDLSGEVQLTFEPTGVVCVVSAPLKDEEHQLAKGRGSLLA